MTDIWDDLGSSQPASAPSLDDRMHIRTAGKLMDSAREIYVHRLFASVMYRTNGIAYCFQSRPFGLCASELCSHEHTFEMFYKTFAEKRV